MNIVDILGKLVPNVYTMAAQLSATALLFFLLYKLAYKPVCKILEERSNFEQEKLKKAQELLKEAQDSNAQIKANELAAKNKAEQIVLEAENKAKEILEKANLEGQEEVKNLLEKANKQIDEERSRMLKNVQEEIIGNVFTTLEDKLETYHSQDIDETSVKTFLKEVSKK